MIDPNHPGGGREGGRPHSGGGKGDFSGVGAHGRSLRAGRRGGDGRGGRLRATQLRDLDLGLLEALGEDRGLLAQVRRLTSVSEVEQHKDRETDDRGKARVCPYR